MSGVCLRGLENPPTLSPTLTGGLTAFYYPDYETPWDRATCLNTLPLPFTHGGRPTYSTKEACCAGAYGGQVSKACICSLDNPPHGCPTSSPVATAVREKSNFFFSFCFVPKLVLIYILLPKHFRLIWSNYHDYNHSLFVKHYTKWLDHPHGSNR